MLNKKEKGALNSKAIIYCRVSSTKQKIEGSGLESQEHRCRQYAQSHGYDVEAVFPDDASGGGDFIKRPGMVALLSYLDAQPGNDYVVIFDDLKRFARDTEFHIKLRREFHARGARIECLNFKLDDSPEGRFVETIFAAQGELEREQNRRQVIQKMKARTEKGYWVFQAPIGFRYANDRAHGKVLVRDEPHASIIQEAFEGFASGRFQTQTEVQHFLERQPEFPKNTPSGGIHKQFVHKLLRRAVYAGYVEAPSWQVTRRKGQHEGLISITTFEKVQERLLGKARAPVRKDVREDFPLRGFVLCDDCDTPLTAGWSKGKLRAYPYYFCRKRGCESYGKSIRRDQLEAEFADVLKCLEPSKSMFALMKAMFKDAWDMRAAQAKNEAKAIKSKVLGIEKQIEGLLDRIVEATNPTIISAYEQRIAKLEKEKSLVIEQVRMLAEPKITYGDALEHALAFLSSPWKIWINHGLELKRIVLRLAFLEPLRYARNQGVRTPKTSLPFNMLGEIHIRKSAMVEPRGVEPLTS